MKHNLILLYKELGQTPLDAISIYKEKYHNNDKLSFAGRLDPMAEGLLLILVNDENKNRKEYEALDKTYLFSFVTGFATDTYDLLGKVTKETPKPINLSKTTSQIEKVVAQLPGKKVMFYPPYSSYHVNGKPLYYLARKGQLPSPLPSKEISIHSAEILKHEILEKAILTEEINRRISLVHGNFRQEEIIDLWNEVVTNTMHQEFLLTYMKITCSSGTYVRQLVQTIGDSIGIPTVTFSIERIAIGPYTVEDSKRKI